MFAQPIGEPPRTRVAGGSDKVLQSAPASFERGVQLHERLDPVNAGVPVPIWRLDVRQEFAVRERKLSHNANFARNVVQESHELLPSVVVRANHKNDFQVIPPLVGSGTCGQIYRDAGT